MFLVINKVNEMETSVVLIIMWRSTTWLVIISERLEILRDNDVTLFVTFFCTSQRMKRKRILERLFSELISVVWIPGIRDPSRFRISI